MQKQAIRGACACFSFELSIWWLFDRDTQRRACILPGSLATSCPSALGRGQGDTGHTHLPLNPPTVASAEKQSLSLRRSHRSTHLLWQEKHLWHLESSLYVWLCVGAAVRAWSGWRDAGKSSMSSPLSLPPPDPLSNSLSCENHCSICSHGSLHAGHVLA